MIQTDATAASMEALLAWSDGLLSVDDTRPAADHLAELSQVRAKLTAKLEGLLGSANAELELALSATAEMKPQALPAVDRVLAQYTAPSNGRAIAAMAALAALQAHRTAVLEALRDRVVAGLEVSKSQLCTQLTGACTINRPCAQQYVGNSQSCMVISGRLIVHAPVHICRCG